MWTGFSAAATSALAGNCKVEIQVQVFNSSGVFLEDITYAVTSGQVVEDETAEIRRTLTLNLNDPALIPSEPTDLLHPLSANEVYVWRGVWVEGAAAPELAPLGVFRLSKPQTTDTNSSVTLTITGNDRSFEISRQSWTGPYTAAAGQTVPAAIKAIINSRWNGPPLIFNMAPSTVTVPAGTVLGVQYTSSGPQAASGSTSGSNDPWADCQALAVSAGCELFFDRIGAVTLRPVPEPGTNPTAASYIEGPGCLVTQGSRTLDETSFFNGVILIGTGVLVTNADGSKSPGAPVVATVWSTDPNLGPSGPLGERPDFVTDPTVSTTGQATAAANAKLSLVMSQLDTTTFTAVDNPALDAGDQDFLQRARMQLSGYYIIQTITHPLDASTQMSVTNRSYSVTV